MMWRLYVRRFFPAVVALVGFLVAEYLGRAWSLRSGPVHVRNYLCGFAIADFWTTNNEVYHCVWTTNFSSEGIVITGRVVTNKAW